MKITKRQLRQIIREEISRTRPRRRTRRRRIVREAKSPGALSDVVSILKAYKRAADQGELGEDRFLSDFLDQSGETAGSRWLRSLDHEDFREIENDIAGPSAVSSRQIKSYVSDRWGDEINVFDPGPGAAPWVNLDSNTKKSVIRFLSTWLSKEGAKSDDDEEVVLVDLVYNDTPGYDPFAGWTAAEKRGAADAREWLKSTGEPSMIGVYLTDLLDDSINPTPKAIEKAIVAALLY